MRRRVGDPGTAEALVWAVIPLARVRGSASVPGAARAARTVVIRASCASWAPVRVAGFAHSTGIMTSWSMWLPSTSPVVGV